MFPAPLFRDPLHDGAADPSVLWNPRDEHWWMFYTARRANAPGPGVGWAHGTSIGVARSVDGSDWVYAGALSLRQGWGHDTWWAPEVVELDGLFHLFVTHIEGVPQTWAGHERHIEHFTSDDLVDWTHVHRVELGSDHVIDACVYPIPAGGWRMWFKDEASGSTTWSSDSLDLSAWGAPVRVIGGRPHEGPNVFALGGSFWMFTDEWRGQAVYRSGDLTNWAPAGHLLDTPGTRSDDGGVGLHADVIVQGDLAYVFYFTHPERLGTPKFPEAELTAPQRRTSVQVAVARVIDGRLVCDRNEGSLPPLVRPGADPC